MQVTDIVNVKINLTFTIIVIRTFRSIKKTPVSYFEETGVFACIRVFLMWFIV